MPKSIKKRVSKKTVTSEADVKNKLVGLKDTLKERKKTALTYGVGILVILIVIVSFLVYNYTSQKKAKIFEYEAYKIYYNTPAQSVTKEEQYKKALDIFKKGDINEATKTLDTLYSLNSDIYKDLALIEYGRLLEKAGKIEEAKKKYKELTTRFPNSPFMDEAKAKLSEKKEG